MATTLENLTLAMNRLEVEIARQQKYIMKWGDHNDKNPDTQWIQYKEDAEYNLTKWDQMKAMRDQLKTA